MTLIADPESGFMVSFDLSLLLARVGLLTESVDSTNLQGMIAASSQGG